MKFMGVKMKVGDVIHFRRKIPGTGKKRGAVVSMRRSAITVLMPDKGVCTLTKPELLWINVFYEAPESVWYESHKKCFRQGQEVVYVSSTGEEKAGFVVAAIAGVIAISTDDSELVIEKAWRFRAVAQGETRLME